MRAVIYARISRAPEASADTSTPRQIANCRSYLRAKSWDEHAVRRDVDRSAYRQGVTREGFEALLHDVTSGAVDVVVVWKLDRLTRRPGDFERFWTLCEHHRVALASVTEPIDTTGPIGVAIVRLLLTFAGIESSVRGERLAAKFKEQALQGLPTRGGRRPFGHSRDLSRTIESEAVLLREAARRVIDGESTASITRDFDKRGVIGAHGVPWSASGLKSTLVSARLAGDRSYRGEVVVEGCFAHILDRRTHQLVSSLLTDTPKRMRPKKSLLQGLLICGRCGRTMILGRSSTNVQLYRCPRPPAGCERVSVTAHCVDPLAVEVTRHRLRSPQAMPEVSVTPASALALRDLNRAFFRDHSITRSEWYGTRQAIVGGAQVRASWWKMHPDVPAGATGRQLDEEWHTLARSAQHALIAAVVDRITVHPQPAHTRGFRRERLHFKFRDPSGPEITESDHRAVPTVSGP